MNEAAITIRTAGPADADAIWATVGPALPAGETYAMPRDLSREDALAYWQGADRPRRSSIPSWASWTRC